MTKTFRRTCVRVVQPIGTFFITTIEASKLHAISFADIRRPEGRDIERYIGTQRELSEGRVAEIKKYVTNVDACFPTAVILSVKSTDVEFDESTSELVFNESPNVAKIIDGQHRIAGLENYSGREFNVNATVFIDMDIEDQAMTFATINLNQTKVSKSLTYDLYEYAKSRSPQKTLHTIAKYMHWHEKSPLKGRIKILGKVSQEGRELISQATFVDRFLSLITRDAMKDRDRIKREIELDRAVGRWQDKLIFRDWFIEGKDADMAKTIWNYFLAISERWPNAWSNTDRGMILARTTGFAAFVRLLPRLVTTHGGLMEVISASTFLDDLQRSTLADQEFTSTDFPPGSSGESKLFKVLESQLVV